MKKKIFTHIVLIIAFYLIGLIATFGINYNFNTKTLDVIALMKDSLSLIVAGVLYLIYITMKLISINSKDSSGNTSQGVDPSGEKIEEFANSRWVTEKELTTEKKFNFCKFSQLGNVKKDGIVIRAELEPSGKDILVNMYKPLHTLIVGTSGSGKTETFVNPSLQVWAKCASKPSVVISDPKTELYVKHAKNFIDNGYKVISLNLRDPYSSSKWNPMSYAYRLYHRALHLEREVKKYIGGRPDPSKFQIMDESYGNEWFGFCGVAYPNEDMLKRDITSLKSELTTKAFISLKEFAMALCPIKNKNDPSWEQGAQNFIAGIAIAMLEDSADPTLGMTEEKFCPYNLAEIACHKDTGDDNYKSVKEYLQGRPRESKAMALASTAVFNAPNTTKSYMGMVTNALDLFQEDGVNYITSGTDIELGKLTDVPTAFFLIIPDEEKARHAIATVCISQLYQNLIEVANKNENRELPRTCYFMLDEFANLPELPNFSQLITVGRSRRIFFCMVIQSYTQLDNVYSEKGASIIRDNSNINIYIGTDDQKTKENFSKLCGDTSIQLDKKSSSKDKHGENAGYSINKETKQRPLIYPDELGHIEQGINIVKIFKEYPMKNKFTHSYKCTNVYNMKNINEGYKPKGFFDPNATYYDFIRRNSLKFVGNNDDFNDLF